MATNPEQVNSSEQTLEQQEKAYDFSGVRETEKLLKEIGVSSVDELSSEQEERFRTLGNELFEQEAMPYGNRKQLITELDALFNHRADIAAITTQDPQILYLFSHCKALEQQRIFTSAQTKAYMFTRFGWRNDTPINMQEMDAALTAFSISHRNQLLEKV